MSFYLPAYIIVILLDLFGLNDCSKPEWTKSGQHTSDSNVGKQDMLYARAVSRNKACELLHVTQHSDVNAQ